MLRTPRDRGGEIASQVTLQRSPFCAALLDLCAASLIRGEPGKELVTIDGDQEERARGQGSILLSSSSSSSFFRGLGGVEGGGLPLPALCSDYLIRGEPGKELVTIDADHKERARGREFFFFFFLSFFLSFFL